MRPWLHLILGAACLANLERPALPPVYADQPQQPAEKHPIAHQRVAAEYAPLEFKTLACLRSGYGVYIDGVEKDAQGTWIVMKGARRILWEDGKQKSFEEKLDAPDLSDQLDMTYRRGPLIQAPAMNDDPGRIRHANFFKAVYGEDKQAVRANLAEVTWLPGQWRGTKLMFNRMNGAAAALERVSAALMALPRALMKYVNPTAGTFNRRDIAGTNRPSAHGLGIAIDINPNFGDYWRWRRMTSPMVYRNRVPFEIVEVFENNGFIWGGKWFHFDTLHFEYRPELLSPPCVR